MKTISRIVLLLFLTAIIFSCSKDAEKKQSEQYKPEFKNEPLGNTTESTSGYNNEVSKKEISANATYKDKNSANSFVVTNDASSSTWSTDSAFKNTPGLSSSAARTDNDNGRKFIRTAEIKFRAKNVINTSYEIEDIISKSKGIVSSTNLRSIVDEKNIVKMSEDSAIETTKYSFENTMTIRVPNKNLDTALKSIAKLVDFMDYRVIKADDATLRMLANQQEGDRSKHHVDRVKHMIDTKSSKLTPVIDAESDILESEKIADDALMANNELNDQVNFSTINLTIYQKQETASQMILLDKTVKPYEPPFSIQMTNAFNSGLVILESILLVFAKLWFILILVIILFYTIRIIKHHQKRIAASFKN